MSPTTTSGSNQASLATASQAEECLTMDHQDYQLKYRHYWDIRLPPVKKKMVHGQLMPTLRSFVQIPLLTSKPRRLALEIYQAPSTNNTSSESRVTRTSELPEALDNEDMVVLRLLKPLGGAARASSIPKKPRSQAPLDDDGDDDSSLSDDDSHDGLNIGILGYNANLNEIPSDRQDDTATNWRERYRSTLETIAVSKSLGRVCDLKYGAGSDTKVRGIYFDATSECKEFGKLLKELKHLEQERATRMAQAYSVRRGSTSPQHGDAAGAGGETPQGQAPGGATGALMSIFSSPFAAKARSMIPLGQKPKMDGTMPVKLLFEIVSASNLPKADLLSCDPYIIVFEGAKEVHRTKYIAKDINPIWTLGNGALFYVETTVEEYFRSSSTFKFVIKDYDAVGANEVLGTVEVSKDAILSKGTGARIEYPVELDKKALGKNNKKAPKATGIMMGGNKPTLALRYKHATDDEIQFLKDYQINKKSRRKGVYQEESFLDIRPHKVKRMTRNHRNGSTGTEEHLVKPFPDPTNPTATTWMTTKELNIEARKPSTSWIESGSGKLGKVWLEVIGCDGLPDLDLSLTGRNKTDAFVTIVFEDCVVNTDVINDTLKPRWLPWTQRAFVFNIMHPSSQLMLGVFDFDAAIAPGNAKHDRIGKVDINISNFVPNTVYTLKYNLITQGQEGLESNGTISVRLRIEIFDERKTVMEALAPPRPTYVSVARKSDFRNTHFTIMGEEDSKLSLKTITSYLDELKAYLIVFDFIQTAVMTVVLWRGHYDVSFPVIWPHKQEGRLQFSKRVTIWLPLHSITAFVWGVLVCQRPDRMLGFFFFSIGWFFLACMEHVRQHPSPWKKSRSFHDILAKLLFSQSLSAETIQPNQNITKIEEYEKDYEERQKQNEEAAKSFMEEKEKLANELNAVSDDLNDDDVDITTKAPVGLNLGFNVTPFKGILEQVQKALRKICVALRITKSVVLWREAYFSFWIVVLSFLVSAVVVWIPWSFLLHWIFTIAVWLFLGPWMKLVDILVVRKQEAEAEENRKKGLLAASQQQYQQILAQSLTKKVLRERAVKLQVMKRYMFGRFLMRVPMLKEELQWDDPLPESTAAPYNPEASPPPLIIQRKWGQQLIGDMIPKRYVHVVPDR